MPIKISVVTVVYNRVITIEQSLQSVQQQSWKSVEHIVIDGASTDGTLKVLEANRMKISVLVSERDQGIYDALNKGFSLATGDVIGVMHSDDLFADPHVLQRIADRFSNHEVDAVYGDLDYVGKENTNRVIRRWRPGEFSLRKLAWGWMPPHPTLYLRRSVVEKYGGFDTTYRIAADYDAILRYFAVGRIRANYIPEILVKMRVGGESNRSLSRLFTKTREDLRALRSNKVGGMGALIWKNLSKVGQFF